MGIAVKYGRSLDLSIPDSSPYFTRKPGKGQLSSCYDMSELVVPWYRSPKDISQICAHNSKCVLNCTPGGLQSPSMDHDATSGELALPFLPDLLLLLLLLPLQYEVSHTHSPPAPLLSHPGEFK